MKHRLQLVLLLLLLASTDIRVNAANLKRDPPDVHGSEWHLAPRIGIFALIGTTNIRIHLDKIHKEKITIRVKDGKQNVLLSYNLSRRLCGMKAQVINFGELPDDQYRVEVSNGVETVAHEFKLTTSPRLTVDAQRKISEIL